MRVQTVGALLFPTGYVDTDSDPVTDDLLPKDFLDDYVGDPVIMTMTGGTQTRPTFSPAALVLIALALLILTSKRG